MVNRGKKNLLGILIDAVDYDAALDAIFRSAHSNSAMAVSALAVHGVMTGAKDSEHRHRLNNFELVVPDGQPVRWALNLLYGADLKDRVYGPELSLRTLQRAAQEGVPVYFYGTNDDILAKLRKNLAVRFPQLQVTGAEPSLFRSLTGDEQEKLISRIRASGARIVFAGLGCPRQEVFAYEIAQPLSMPVLAVGAAFLFLSGTVPQAPPLMQRAGLEWLFRLLMEPRRLWRRYVYLNPEFMYLVALQWLRLREFSSLGRPPSKEVRYG